MAEGDVLSIELEKMEALRVRVLQLARDRGLTQQHLEKAAKCSHSTYDGMWRRGTVTLIRLERMAQRLGMTVDQLLSDQPTEPRPIDVADPPAEWKPADRPQYIEDRVERLETELRKIKTQIQNR